MVDASLDLSVVFVTRNEEEHIEECIRTTMEAVEEARLAGLLRTVEYVLVDSASTDRTLEIASRFPVRILQLEPSWPLSCGAGCSVGLEQVHGTYTAIVNADMTIDRGWLVGAIEYMTADVAGVCAVATEDLPGRTPTERMVRRHSTVPDLSGPLPPEVASHPGGYSTGTILLRTEAARKVGSYNPFFRAAEDMDLRYRLVRGGWKVLNVPVHQGRHYWSSRGEPLDAIRYFRTIHRNSIGLGQMARYNLRRDRWVARRAMAPVFNARALLHGLLGLGIIGLFALHLYAGFSRSLPAFIGAFVVDLATGLAFISASRRARIPVREVAFSDVLVPPLFAFVRIAGFLKGYLMLPRGPEDYPTGARVVKA